MPRLLVLLCAFFFVVTASKSLMPAKSRGRSPRKPASSKDDAMIDTSSSSTPEALLQIRGGSVFSGTPAAAATDAAKKGIVDAIKVYSDKVPLHVVKIVLQLALTSFNVLCWLIPLQSKQFSQNTNALSIASCFSGGVFLALALAHLLPHSLEGMDAIKGGKREHTFMAMIAGYLLVLFIEKVAFDSHSLLHEASAGVVGTSAVTADPFQAPSLSLETGGIEPVLVEAVAIEIVDGESMSGYSASAHAHHGHTHTQGGQGALSVNSAVVLLIAMSVHSLLETVALGLAKDKASAVMMAASIGMHQPAETIALLVAFLKTGMSNGSIIKYLSAFSIIGPLGVSLGVIINKVASPRMDALIVALTAGTFIFMGCTEVANEEFEGDGLSQKDKLVRFVAMVGGVLTIIGLTKFGEAFEGGHSHSH